MDINALTDKAKEHLQVLCAEIGERRVGSKENRMATSYAAGVLTGAGWQTVQTPLEVIDWETGGASLTCGGEDFEVFSSHYSLGCSVKGEIVEVDSVARLEQTDIEGRIVLLHGEIASQQIAPKNFPFWNPDEHRHLVSLLEKGRPLALVCATERNSATAGGVYPFPLFEDGDFDIPSVFMKDTEGERLLAYAGQQAELISLAERIPETAYNVVARKGHTGEKRIVVTAHIDTKIGTPGAIDNGTGVAVVLLLAETLAGAGTKGAVELVIFNGEDYYGAPGQVEYIRQNADSFGDILLNINIDGAGYKVGPSCFSPFDLSTDMRIALDEVLEGNPRIVKGDPWYQGDHSLFLQNGRPAIAVSSKWFIDNMESQELTHTPKDNLGIVNYERVAQCAQGITELINRLLPASA